MKRKFLLIILVLAFSMVIYYCFNKKNDSLTIKYSFEEIIKSIQDSKAIIVCNPRKKKSNIKCEIGEYIETITDEHLINEIVKILSSADMETDKYYTASESYFVLEFLNKDNEIIAKYEYGSAKTIIKDNSSYNIQHSNMKYIYDNIYYNNSKFE